MLSGPELFHHVSRCEDEAAFWWLGQHSFVVKLGERVLLIDPFLSEVDGRLVPPLFQPLDACGVVDLVLCTHDHLDHIDPAAIPGLAACSDIAFVAPEACRDRMLSLDVPASRLYGMNHGESIALEGMTIRAIKSAHEQFFQTEEGLYPFLGYVVTGQKRTIYHAGDTVWWEGLQQELSGFHLDVAMIPINGRDAERFEADIVGNMTYQEAGDLVGGLDVGLTVPTHYDMFAFNSEDPGLFIAYMKSRYPKYRVWVGNPTDKVVF
jgi:L-ascorbate metabolism protein UlaG (beta-lactamase superfamily)